jgi:hypothetical protein
MHSEVPHSLPLERIARERPSGTVTATPAQLHLLAQRLRLSSVTAFRFTYAFQPTIWAGVYRVQGDITAEITQECVLTLEQITNTVTTAFNCLCGTPDALLELEEREELAPDEDPPEAIMPEGLDVGELAIQYLSLALNDYPRQTDVSLPDILEQIGHTQQDNPDPDRQHPFTRLQSLLKTPGK